MPQRTNQIYVMNNQIMEQVHILSFFLSFLLFCLTACSPTEEDFTPKPKAYARIVLPDPDYQMLSERYPFTRLFADGIPNKSLLSRITSRPPDQYPFTFAYSRHAQVYPDTSFQAEPYWLEIIYPQLGASIHLTIKFIGNSQEVFEDYVNDTHTLVTRHGVRLQGIADAVSQTPAGDGVKLYDLEGDVPTVFQLAITDSTHNYFRAALYVPYANKNDSLAPILDYVRRDMLHLVETFRFRDIGQYRDL
ncbi:MAG: hypothetical protein ACFCUI_12475 [Bernardetiaceae bacterium]